MEEDSPPPVSTQRAPEHVSELGALVLARPHAGPAVLHTVRYSPPPSARSARPSTCPSWRARAGAAARRARRAAHGTVLAAPVSTQRAPEHVSELGALVLARPHAGPAVLHTVRYSPPPSACSARPSTCPSWARSCWRGRTPGPPCCTRYGTRRPSACSARPSTCPSWARSCWRGRTPGPPCCTRYGTRRPVSMQRAPEHVSELGALVLARPARRARRAAHGTVLAAPVSTQRAPEHVSELGALVLARPHAGPAVLHTVRYSPPPTQRAPEHVSELGALVLARPHAGPAVLHTVRYSPPRQHAARAEHVSELGALVLARPHAGPAVLHTVLRALTWQDSTSSLRATALALPALRAALEAGLVGEAEASGALAAVLQALRAHGQHDANQCALLALAVQKEVYILDLPTMPAPARDKPRSALDAPDGAGLPGLFAPAPT
ncbi:LOW QUALITY PROTEIN: hypothetical protein MSG28_001771 [Choristoneura fumiferana]|uniref:Uncharacterized protein n=1 Tax=Choristoneura fumiferana TaxID=7141 RepID=A0ACC0KW31_CHOFU|nr:LOW QUALITY PROTEIN: hypothetical protein MSG28_001771 [Choristoneura fumiferana]